MNAPLSATMEDVKRPRATDIAGGMTPEGLVPMRMQRTREVYWAAGFIEGEGSFGVSGNLALQVTAVQKEREPLERLQKVIGGKIMVIHWQGRQYHRLGVYGNKRAEPVMRLLRPLMSTRRQGQIDLAIERRVLRDPTNCGNRMKTHCPKGHPYDIFTQEKDGRPHRRCSICVKASSRRRWERIKNDPEYQARAKAARQRHRAKQARA